MTGASENIEEGVGAILPALGAMLNNGALLAVAGSIVGFVCGIGARGWKDLCISAGVALVVVGASRLELALTTDSAVALIGCAAAGTRGVALTVAGSPIPSLDEMTVA